MFKNSRIEQITRYEKGEEEPEGTIKQANFLLERYELIAMDRGKAFEKLISYPNIDTSGYCIEWYYNDNDVKCMITFPLKVQGAYVLRKYLFLLMGKLS